MRENAPLCRWQHGDLTLDVMPVHPAVLGFSNRWYQAALDTALSIKLPSGTRIRLVAAPLFLATKMEAFHSRGENDFYASHDLEDFVAVVEGREEVLQEIQGALQRCRSISGRQQNNFCSNRGYGCIAGIPAGRPGQPGATTAGS